MKRTIAPPGAIVRRTLLNSAVATEEPNDCTSLGNCSLSHHAPKGVRSPHPMPTPTNDCDHSPVMGNRTHSREGSHMTYLGHFPPSFPHHFHLPLALHLHAINSPLHIPHSQAPNHHQTPLTATVIHYTHRKPLPFNDIVPFYWSKSPAPTFFFPTLTNPNLHINCAIFLFLATALYCTEYSYPLWLVFSYFVGGWTTFKVVAYHWV
jgi:hypothetical protein